ncbi:GNAT family N-acetyltransferase [Clostridium faecium]|uniref:GNAT family N-acetyltransferase n=1 Tax=Clostridium faecium TaxID=2762223 RepID=A0ABR8YTJ0_9CLOT|nr:GNAT family N-acetyltransferase [Clostridium faecium]MBD8047560.1 GNAT family N-acetyltransferase [Clostridium faecium]
MSNQIHIRRIDVEEVSIAQDFLFKMVKKLYNSDKNPLYHNDIINMKEVYIENKKNILIGAFDEDGQLIGTIAVKQFVDRFKALNGIYKEELTAELGRCYIDENLRRKGVGSLLFDKILEFCKESGYEKIYLHTHRHLPGGFDFWRKMGFVITVEEDDEEKTVHMEKLVS